MSNAEWLDWRLIDLRRRDDEEKARLRAVLEAERAEVYAREVELEKLRRGALLRDQQAQEEIATQLAERRAEDRRSQLDWEKVMEELGVSDMMRIARQRLSSEFEPIVVRSGDMPGLAQGLSILTKVTEGRVDGIDRFQRAKFDTKHYLHAFLIGIGHSGAMGDSRGYVFSFKSKSFKSGAKSDGLLIREEAFNKNMGVLQYGMFEDEHAILPTGASLDSRINLLGTINEDRQNLLESVRDEIASFVYSAPLIPTIGPENEASTFTSRTLFRIKIRRSRVRAINEYNKAG